MKALLIDFSPFMPPVTPISIRYLGAALKGHGHEAEVLGLGSTSRFSPDAFRTRLQALSPDLVGFVTYQRNIFQVKALAALVKQAVPGAAVIMGGPQTPFLPDRALDGLPHVDFLCRGEGEAVILSLAEAVASGLDGSAVPGTTSRAPGGEYVTGPAVTPARDLDTHPSPWLTDILDPAAMDEAILLTSRGCPFRCAFCYTPTAFGGNVQAHSVDRVLEDIAYVVRRGSGRLWFADPNFSYKESRVVKILEGIARRTLKVEMWIETRADMVNRELLALMKRAGVTLVAMGLESASSEVFPHLDKNLDPDRIRMAVDRAFEAGLDVELFSQFALPHERFQDAMATLKFVKDAGVKIRGNSNAQQMQIYHGSRIAEDPNRFGVKPLRDVFEPYLSIGTEFETEWMTRDEIDRVKRAWRAESLDGGKRVVS